MDAPRPDHPGRGRARRPRGGLKPQLWIVGGPNGSGKSTLIRSGVLDRWTGTRLRALSPDDIVLQLRPDHPEWTEIELLRAAQEASDRMVDDAIAAGRIVMVETVLSSSKFRDPVMRALQAGFEFCFVFVTVVSAGLNTARVQHRVASGGHDVPEDRIIARRLRSHDAATWFAGKADVGLAFDNSGQAPTLLAEKQRGNAGWTILDPHRLATLGLAL